MDDQDRRIRSRILDEPEGDDDTQDSAEESEDSGLPIFDPTRSKHLPR